MRTPRTSGPRGHLAPALAAMVLLLVSVLGLSACGGETASGTTPPAASPGTTASSGPTAGDETGSASPSGAPSDGTTMAASYESPPSYPTEAWTSGTVGWIFRPKVDIRVTELGCYDADQDGLENIHRVGIFDARSERLLAGVKVGPGSTLDGAFRWERAGKPLILKAGHPYVIGTEANPGKEDAQQGHETLYEEGMEQWAAEIHFGGLRTNLGSRVGFSAPTSRKRLYTGYGPRIAWMSPNFKFEHVVRLTDEADNPTHLDLPGTASQAQAEAVAHRFAAALTARAMDRAGLYAADATQDAEGGAARGAELIERYWYDAYHEDPDIIAVRYWSKDYHLLVAPGIVVYEGARLNNDPDDDWRWSVRLLAVDGDQIAHEEVYYEGNGLEDRWPMRFCQTPPGPGDTAEVAARIAAAVGRAFATRDRAALEALLARDVIFPEVADHPGVSGRKALLRWWDMLAPKDTAEIEIRNETPMAGPGWAVVRWTARRTARNWIFPDGYTVSANMAAVIEVRGGKAVRLVPYGTAEGEDSGMVPW